MNSRVPDNLRLKKNHKYARSAFFFPFNLVQSHFRHLLYVTQLNVITENPIVMNL